jgi:hypothetical protein
MRDRAAHAAGSRLAAWIVIAIVSSIAFPYFERTRNANEVPRVLQGIAWVQTGEWSLDGPIAWGFDPGPDVARSPVDGRIYPNKPPGASLAAAAGYAIARAGSDGPADLRTTTRWARILGGLLPTLVLAGLLLRRFADLGPSIVAGVALWALATPAAAYAHLLYGHALAACLSVAGGIACLDAVDPSIVRSRARASALAAAGGLSAGASVGVDYGAVFFAVPLGVALAWAARRPGARAPVVAAVLGALVPIAALALYHDAAFGSPWATGYHHVVDAGFAAKHGQGFLGLSWPTLEGMREHWWSPDGGILWWAPLLPLGVYGLMQLALEPAREGPHRTIARVGLATVIVYLVLSAGLVFAGGWRVGPRYLVVALPWLALGWAYALAQLHTRPVVLAVVAAFTTYAATVNALAANLWPHFDLTNVHQPVAEVLLPLWREDVAPYGVHGGPLSPWAVQLVVIGAVVAAVGAVGSVAEPRLRSLVAVLVGALAGLVLLVPATHLVAPHPRGADNLRYILGQREPAADGAMPASRAIRPSSTPPDRPGQRPASRSRSSGP